MSIHGKKKQKKPGKDESHRMIERSYGAFSRLMRPPAPGGCDRTTAIVKDGLQAITPLKKEVNRERDRGQDRVTRCSRGAAPASERD